MPRFRGIVSTIMLRAVRTLIDEDVDESHGSGLRERKEEICEGKYASSSYFWSLFAVAVAHAHRASLAG